MTKWWISWLGLALLAWGNPFGDVRSVFVRGDEPRHDLMSGITTRLAPLPELVHLPSGMQVKDRVPEGWSHLIFKSSPHLASGALGSLPDSAYATASLFRTVMLADVRPGDACTARYTLRRVGIGLFVSEHGRETVVTAAGLESSSISLSTIARLVLGRAEDELSRGHLVARTPTFALFRSPIMLSIEGKHRKGDLNYAILVDSDSRALRTVIWWTETDLEQRRPAREMVLLPSSLIYDCGLDVSTSRIFGSLPVSWSFAMAEMPPGRTVPMPPRLQEGSVRDRMGPDEAGTFESDLRSSLGDPKQR